MYLKVSQKINKKNRENINHNIVYEFIKLQINSDLYKIETNGNIIKFDFINGFTEHSGRNIRRMWHILRHGYINISDNNECINIDSKIDLKYLTILSLSLSSALFGLSIISNDFLYSILIFLLIFGLFFGFGLLFLLIKMRLLFKI